MNNQLAIKQINIARDIIKRDLLKDSDDYKTGLAALDNAVVELQPVMMTKVFDDFAKQFDLGSQQDEKGLDDALSQILDIYVYGNEEFDDLEDYMRDTGDEEFYADCVKALVFGYEVQE